MNGYHGYKVCTDACLTCAAICNHCASACTKEEDVNMMANCIQPDMECAAACYASVQLISLDSSETKEFVPCVPTYAMPVAKNVEDTI